MVLPTIDTWSAETITWYHFVYINRTRWRYYVVMVTTVGQTLDMLLMLNQAAVFD